MADIAVTLVLPAGGARTAEVPDDVTIRELLPELVSVLELPTTGPDGRPMSYRLDSKALGRELQEEETLAEAGIPAEDRLIITADITAGANAGESPRIRRLRADHQGMMEIDARSDLIDVEAVEAPAGLPPERYIVTFHVPSVAGIDRRGKPKIANKHQVEIYLHSDYPHRWPGLKWLTPVWHPNINHTNGSVCIDAAWWGAARSLDRLVIMMGEMIQYKNFHDDPNTPPFPWDKEAADWCRDWRADNPDFFPTDHRELLRPERVKKMKSQAAPASTPRAKIGGQAEAIKRGIGGKIKLGGRDSQSAASPKAPSGGLSIKLGQRSTSAPKPTSADAGPQTSSRIKITTSGSQQPAAEDKQPDKPLKLGGRARKSSRIKLKK
ncbi:MAG: ubiquitin-conjugating enzyme E2 [Chloroflexota bacterium]